jgi:hypothetical protein
VCLICVLFVLFNSNNLIYTEISKKEEEEKASGDFLCDET